MSPFARASHRVVQRLQVAGALDSSQPLVHPAAALTFLISDTMSGDHAAGYITVAVLNT